ncbi:zinc finger-containing ubiquitin peptidase 1 isoform 2-T3 [Anomaloglossus baeobatrachus]|uniref:zinc finger-containing ubiquitin peptidase 1 isoform X2 n=1 Tax=Anomaloglossus baeobatrachus TaxID=238106 RepID=UPI003F50B1D3
MLVCDICTQEVTSEDDMKSHLLVAHMEQEHCCPFCAVTGLTYDDVSYHIQAAHADTLEPWSSDEDQCDEVLDETTSSTSSSNSTSGQELGTGNHGMTTEGCTGDPDAEQKSTERQSSSKEEDIPRNVVSKYKIPPSEEPLAGGAMVIDDYTPPTASAAYIAGGGDLVVVCPFCCKTKNSIDRLELHVSTEHADLLASPPNKGRANQQYECPMCSLVCANSDILQEHVNLHLEENCDPAKLASDAVLARQLQAEEDRRRRVEESEQEKAEFQKLQRQIGLDNSAGYQQQSVQNRERAVGRGRMHPIEFRMQKAEMMESLATGVDDGRTKTTAKITSDAVLARQLQAEEDRRRRVEESEREKAEFQKLQRQFGLDNSGGYRQQSVQNLEQAVARGRMHPIEFHMQKAEMMESLATGVDDGRTKTSGVMEALHRYYSTAGPEVHRVWLCSPLDHLSSSGGDKGWGCGFRNFQMLFSSVFLSDTYKDFLPDNRYIPCIPKIQALIEDAWKEGFDPQGASHFNSKLLGTRAWIGASEIYCLLTSLRLKNFSCKILKLTNPAGTCAI